MVLVLFLDLPRYFPGDKKKETVSLWDMIANSPVYTGQIPAHSIVGVVFSFGTYGTVVRGEKSPPPIRASWNLYSVLILATPAQKRL